MQAIALPGLVNPHDLTADRQFSMFRFKRYEPTRLREMLESLGWDQLASYPYGIEDKSAAQLLLSSASSKTAYGTAFQLAQREGIEVIGLTSPGNGNIWRRALLTHNLGISYRLRPNMTLFANANNFTENGPELYTYISSRPRQLLISPTFIKFGVSGQF